MHCLWYVLRFISIVYWIGGLFFWGGDRTHYVPGRVAERDDGLGYENLVGEALVSCFFLLGESFWAVCSRICSSLELRSVISCLYSEVRSRISCLYSELRSLISCLYSDCNSVIRLLKDVVSAAIWVLREVFSSSRAHSRLDFLLLLALLVCSVIVELSLSD